MCWHSRYPGYARDLLKCVARPERSDLLNTKRCLTSLDTTRAYFEKSRACTILYKIEIVSCLEIPVASNQTMLLAFTFKVDFIVL